MKLTSKYLYLSALTLAISSCQLFQRDPSRSNQSNGFYRNLHQDLEVERRQHQERQARTDLGLPISAPLSDFQRARLSQRMAVESLEDGLTTQAEKRQYYRVKGLLKSDQQRIQFLQLSTMSEREKFLRLYEIGISKEYSEETQDLIENKDIAKGMSEEMVRQSWGDPDSVEVAGDPIYQNKRWKYSKYVTTSDGYQKQSRYVYFESGLVAGWETD